MTWLEKFREDEDYPSLLRKSIQKIFNKYYVQAAFIEYDITMIEVNDAIAMRVHYYTRGKKSKEDQSFQFRIRYNILLTESQSKAIARSTLKSNISAILSEMNLVKLYTDENSVSLGLPLININEVINFSRTQPTETFGISVMFKNNGYLTFTYEEIEVLKNELEKIGRFDLLLEDV